MDTTVLCPRCFSKYEKKDLAWGCANSDCAREGIPTSSDLPSPKCVACNKPMALRFCPNCGFEIPLQDAESYALPISIVGSQGSGKSHYLTVLINEIRDAVGLAYNCSLYPIGGDDTIVQYQQHYYAPLYENKTMLPATRQEDVRPMIYSLIFNSAQVGKISTLTFYDACGENFTNERVMADYNRSIYNSRGILFLVDPSQLPGIREMYLEAGLPVLKEDFSALLARTIQLVRSKSGERNLKKKITIPIAVCISKLDMILDQIDSSSYLHYRTRHLDYAAFDLIDFECVNEEVQALLENWSSSDLLNQVKSQFEHVGFFAFSALGSTPDEHHRIPHVSPYRVVDPFLWLLAKNKVIRAKKHVPTKK